MALASLVLVQAALELSGIVFGPNSKPMAGATVQAGSAVVRTDAKGRFKLKVPEGQHKVLVTAKGMEPMERTITPGESLYVMLEPKMASAVVEVVDGSSYGTEGTPGSAMTRMEIYTTPGAAADVFQATKTLPGVSNTSEGAELFVRGGKPDEVGIFLNGGRMAHPFHHPSTQGGIFSAVDTALVTSVNFIPGGFSARYGDALSAVLDLSADGATVRRSGIAVLNLASQGVAVDQPMGGGLLRASARYANTALLDHWFHLSRNFQESPISEDLHLGYQAPVGDLGRISLLALGSRDHLAVDTTIANLTNTYRNQSDTAFLSATYNQALSDAVAFSLSASRTGYGQKWTFGPWGIDQSETNLFHRLEMVFQPSQDFALESGLDGDQTKFSPRGSVPEDLSNWNPATTAKVFAYDFDARREGFYSTLRWRLDDAWGLSLGGRTDHYGLLKERTWDWRGTLSYRPTEILTLRLAGGTFHQSPPMTNLDPYVGNPQLSALKATHVVLALDAKNDRAAMPWQLRIEAYAKTYGHLVMENILTHYDGSGHGTARGVDLLFKARKGSWHGSLGYGYLFTQRREEKQYVEGNVPTSVPHNLTTVLGWTPKDGWELSSTYRLASGSPYTPILGGIADGSGGYLPIEGTEYDQRLPLYHRTDVRLTHMFAKAPFRFVAFLEVMNFFNHPNLAGYSYTEDYSQRLDNPSYFSRRIAVVGLTVMW